MHPIVFLMRIFFRNPSLLIVHAVVLLVICCHTQLVYAQRVLKKIGEICPLGYIETLGGECTTLGLIDYVTAPAANQKCPAGWRYVGGDYCRKLWLSFGWDSFGADD